MLRKKPGLGIMGTKERIGIQTNDGLLTVKKARYILCHFKGFQLVVTVLSSLNYFVIFSISGITNETNDNQFSFLLFFSETRGGFSTSKTITEHDDSRFTSIFNQVGAN